MLKYAIPAAAALALAITSPALAVTGLTKAHNSNAQLGQTTRTTDAICPAGKRVVGGGGGLLRDAVNRATDVVITQMIPVHPLTGPDYYRVTAQQTGSDDAWIVQAQAMCADPVPGMHTVLAASTLSSSSLQEAEASCKSGERVLGTGAWVVQATAAQVGLQVFGADPGGTLGYAQAHEDANGYGGDWNVLAYAICAPASASYAVVSTPSPDTDSLFDKYATASCPSGTQVTGAGGGVASTAPGGVVLSYADIADGLRKASANGFESTSTSASWGLTAQVLCA
jgi:hypothetical protein